ncbi:MAG: polyprenyl synthetase family protein [Candidatus Micrarchaeaceae archaeon]
MVESSKIDSLLSEKSKIINETIVTYLKRQSNKEYMTKILGKTNYEYDEKAFEKGVLDPLWYLLDLGGKRWRPILTLLFIEALGKKPEDYVEFATITEIIHNATLIHDDIEDNSLTRRGSPAVHVKYGLDIATNLGDYMMFFPLHMLFSSKKLSESVKAKLTTSYLSNMVRVTIGQATDISWHAGLIKTEEITENKYLEMSNNKTGVLSRFACELAGILCEVDDKTIKTLGNFGAALGIAFQIQDDLLNIDDSKVSESKGGVGDDISEGKITLMVIQTLNKASKDDKEKLLKILSEHTKEKQKIHEAISIIKKYNSFTYCKNLAHKIINDSLNEIEQILKESKSKQLIREFAEFMINRNK